MDDARRQRRPRRAVRAPGTVGSDESVLRSTVPAVAPTGEPSTSADAPPSPAADRRTGATPSTAADDLWRTTRSADDSDHGWGREDAGPDDDRLRREKPPHW